MPNNFSNFGPGTTGDPLASFSNWGPTAPKPAKPSAPSGIQATRPPQAANAQGNQWGSLGSNIPMTMPANRGVGFHYSGFKPYQQSISQTGPSFGTQQSPQANHGNPLGMAQDWFQGLGNAMGYDIRTQQGAMNEQFARNEQQSGMYEDALQRGIGTMQQAGLGEKQAAQQQAAKLDTQGKQQSQDFLKFRDQQMAQTRQDIGKANQFAAQGVETWNKAIGDFKDMSAQTAANAAFGLRRSTQEAMQQINSGMNPDGTMMSPAEQQAARMQLTQTTEQQVSQSVTGIMAQVNDQMAQMKGTLASLQMGQGQQAMAGAQLGASTGVSYGGMTLQNDQTRNDMARLSSQLTMTGEQAYAAALQQSVAMELQGRTTMAEMIRANPRSFVSMYAGLTGYLAGATTPGIESIGLPNFGAMA